MARNKKVHYYVLLIYDEAYVFVTIATAQVEGYYLLKEATGDEEWSRSFINSIDDNFLRPPYPPKELPRLDVRELERLLNNIALGA